MDYLAEHLHVNMLTELAHEAGARSVPECFNSAYLITDIQSSKQGLNVSGSTAATCLLRREDESRRVLYSANVGDSRAVLCRAGAAERLTYDHKASDGDEIKRIEDAGGFVLRKRVLGILSVSRSFGDHAMKKFVVARPYTTTTVLRDTDEFIILACDGVWDVMSDQEAVDLVRAALKEAPEDTGRLGRLLVDESLSRGSTDNVSALIIGLA